MAHWPILMSASISIETFWSDGPFPTSLFLIIVFSIQSAVESFYKEILYMAGFEQWSFCVLRNRSASSAVTTLCLAKINSSCLWQDALNTRRWSWWKGRGGGGGEGAKPDQNLSHQRAQLENPSHDRSFFVQNPFDLLSIERLFTEDSWELDLGNQIKTKNGAFWVWNKCRAKIFYTWKWS